MTTTRKFSKTEREEATERLREWIKPGDTIYTILRHVASSGMSRVIDVIGFGPDEYASRPGDMRIFAYGYNAAAAIDMRYDRERNGIKVGGCGMDMGFHVVYSLSRTLFPDGHGCIGEGCPSNDHSNGDRDYTPHSDTHEHWHRDGGYALRHKWI